MKKLLRSTPDFAISDKSHFYPYFLQLPLDTCRCLKGMAKNKIILVLDGSSEMEELLDLVSFFSEEKENKVIGLIPQSLLSYNLLEVFDGEFPHPSVYSFYEILEKIMHFSQGGSNPIANRILDKCRTLKMGVKIIFDATPLTKILERESLFADLIMMNYAKYYHLPTENVPEYGVSISLEESKNSLEVRETSVMCPVMVVPSGVSRVGQVILNYDGGEESVMAIKQFAHLFPNLCKDVSTCLLATYTEKDVLAGRCNPEEEALLMDYTRLHFQEVAFKSLTHDQENLARFIDWGDFPLLVTGKLKSFDDSMYNQGKNIPGSSDTMPFFIMNY